LLYSQSQKGEKRSQGRKERRKLKTGPEKQKKKRQNHRKKEKKRTAKRAGDNATGTHKRKKGLVGNPEAESGKRKGDSLQGGKGGGNW